MTYLNGCFLLHMKRAFLIGVFWKIDPHYLILAGAWTMIGSSLIHRHLWKALSLITIYLFFTLRPLELKGLIFELPFVSHPVLDQSIELGFRIYSFRLAGVDVSLLNVLEGRSCITEEGSILVIVSEVIGLCSVHPFWHVFTIFAWLVSRYVELIRNFLLWTATSELYLVALLPKLLLKKLFWRALVPMLSRELYILLILFVNALELANSMSHTHHLASFWISLIFSSMSLFFFRLH